MTPEQTIIFTIVVGACAFFGAYIREKGKNLATKEDVAKITRTQEEIRNELANRGHFDRVRYEMETKIYGQIWEKLIAFNEAVQSLVVRKDHNTDPDQIKKYNDTRNDLIDAIKNNQPFYPREIWQELIKSQQLCQSLRMLKDPDFWSDQELRKEYLELPSKIQTQLNKVEEAIRNRLSKFD